MRWVRVFGVVAVACTSVALLLHTLLDPEGWTRRAKVETDLAAVEQENDRLEGRITELRAEIKALRQRREVVERVVRDELGVVGPREVVIELGDAAKTR